MKMNYKNIFIALLVICHFDESFTIPKTMMNLFQEIFFLLSRKPFRENALISKQITESNIQLQYEKFKRYGYPFEDGRIARELMAIKEKIKQKTFKTSDYETKSLLKDIVKITYNDFHPARLDNSFSFIFKKNIINYVINDFLDNYCEGKEVKNEFTTIIIKYLCKRYNIEEMNNNTCVSHISQKLHGKRLTLLLFNEILELFDKCDKDLNPIKVEIEKIIANNEINYSPFNDLSHVANLLFPKNDSNHFDTNAFSEVSRLLQKYKSTKVEPDTLYRYHYDLEKTLLHLLDDKIYLMIREQSSHLSNIEEKILKNYLDPSIDLSSYTTMNTLHHAQIAAIKDIDALLGVSLTSEEKKLPDSLYCKNIYRKRVLGLAAMLLKNNAPHEQKNAFKSLTKCIKNTFETQFSHLLEQ